ncbi:MAG: AAA family ATPase, partial [Candidatus Paceibacterota bacterium]
MNQGQALDPADARTELDFVSSSAMITHVARVSLHTLFFMNQDQALEILQKGIITYVTGPAGSGKTHLLNRYIDWCKDQGKKVAVTASTGIAATHIEGRTIHSWSGIGIRDDMDKKQIDALAQKEFIHKRYNETDVLIIDEVSMLSASQL